MAEFFNTLSFNTLRCLGTTLLKTFFSFKVENVYYVPSTGPFIITANHFSFMDPPVLQAACPRRIIFMMTEKYYSPLWGRWFFKLMYCIPLRDDTPYNIGALKKGVKLLSEEKVIGIFPEGSISRNGVLREGRPGTLLLAQKSGVPVIPAFISGTFQALPKGAKFFRKAKIKVIFGKPIHFGELSKGLTEKERVKTATEHLMKKIKELAISQD